MESGAIDRAPLMFIHGAWLSSNSWENFVDYFEHRGYDVSAPEWPRKEGDVEALREASDEIEGLGLTEIVDHYEHEIQALDEPPVLIGHSYGGLIVGAEKDHTVPASLAHKQYEKYEKSPAQTDYIEFAGRLHLMMIGAGWEEVAAGIETWVVGVLEKSGARAREHSS